MTVWCNGVFSASGEVTLPAFDPAFSGLGAFETLLAKNGKCWALEAHQERLRQSLALLTIPEPDTEPLQEVISELLKRNSLEDGEARIRVVVSGTPEGAASMIVTVCEYQKPSEMVTLGISKRSIFESNPLRKAKTLSYAENWLFHFEAAALGVDDVLVGNSSGHLVEASMANVIVRHRGILKTPPLSAGCLSGITRDILLKKCKTIQEEEILIEDLAEVDEIWLCSSLRRMQYATSLNGREFDRPSCHYFELSEALEILIENEGL
ncbi:MAG: aminotransferase class IV [Akkermansiaceae bacterium]